MLNLNIWEKKVIIAFLEDFKYRLSNDGCNDTAQEIIDLIPKDQLVIIDKKFYELIGDCNAHNKSNPTAHYNNIKLIAYIIERLKEDK